jgi:peptidoglycan/xylan/chitin deacetylase (PgdA/CDA1 family)
VSVTRGDFLKQLGKSLPGMVLGSGAAVAAQKLLGKMAAVSGASSLAEIPAVATKSAPAQDVRIEFIKSGPTTGIRIALTFDDGPTPGVTDRILDELKQRKLHASFFMIGERIAAAPELARRVLAEGHDVCNHTFTHPHLDTLPDQQVEEEIQKTQDIMRDVLSHRPKWFRPPYGGLRQNQAGMPAKRDLGIVFWNVDPGDWAQPGQDKISGKILAETKPGSIILCHDTHLQTADAMTAVLDGLLERGLKFSTLSTLLNQS